METYRGISPPKRLPAKVDWGQLSPSSGDRAAAREKDEETISHMKAKVGALERALQEETQRRVQAECALRGFGASSHQGAQPRSTSPHPALGSPPTVPVSHLLQRLTPPPPVVVASPAASVAHQLRMDRSNQCTAPSTPPPLPISPHNRAECDSDGWGRSPSPPPLQGWERECHAGGTYPSRARSPSEHRRPSFPRSQYGGEHSPPHTVNLDYTSPSGPCVIHRWDETGRCIGSQRGSCPSRAKGGEGDLLEQIQRLRDELLALRQESKSDMAKRGRSPTPPPTSTCHAHNHGASEYPSGKTTTYRWCEDESENVGDRSLRVREGPPADRRPRRYIGDETVRSRWPSREQELLQELDYLTHSLRREREGAAPRERALDKRQLAKDMRGWEVYHPPPPNNHDRDDDHSDRRASLRPKHPHSPPTSTSAKVPISPTTISPSRSLSSSRSSTPHRTPPKRTKSSPPRGARVKIPYSPSASPPLPVSPVHRSPPVLPPSPSNSPRASPRGRVTLPPPPSFSQRRIPPPLHGPATVKHPP